MSKQNARTQTQQIAEEVVKHLRILSVRDWKKATWNRFKSRKIVKKFEGYKHRR